MIPSQSALQTALRTFLLSALPAGIEVIEGNDSRVAEPGVTDFVVMTTIARERLSTNITLAADAAFTGSVAGTTLTVTSIRFGTISPGAPLYGPSLGSGLTIVSQLTGAPGGAGTYTISAAATSAAGPLAAGQVTLTQPARVHVQLDFHSANVGDSADMAMTISTLFRSDAAVVAMFSSGVIPLHADDPRMIPFLNAEQQVETRWIVDAALQANEQIAWPQDFADSVTVTFKPAG